MGYPIVTPPPKLSTNVWLEGYRTAIELWLHPFIQVDQVKSRSVVYFSLGIQAHELEKHYLIDQIDRGLLPQAADKSFSSSA